jgi:hypothetical protein
MKLKALLLALAAAGFAASFALADEGGKGKGGSTTASTTSDNGKSGKKCKNVSFHGTAPATSFTVTVERSNEAARSLKGKPVTLTFSGKVHVNAFMCTAGAGGTSITTTTTSTAPSTFQLRNLKVGKPKDDDD